MGLVVGIRLHGRTWELYQQSRPKKNMGSWNHGEDEGWEKGEVALHSACLKECAWFCWWWEEVKMLGTTWPLLNLKLGDFLAVAGNWNSEYWSYFEENADGQVDDIIPLIKGLMRFPGGLLLWGILLSGMESWVIFLQIYASCSSWPRYDWFCNYRLSSLLGSMMDLRRDS